MKPNRRETISLLAAAAPAFGALAGAGATAHAQEPKRGGRAPTGQDRPHTIETRIGRLEFTHDFADGYPTDATLDKLYEERDFQRACQAYLWSLPAVSFVSWQRGVTNGLGARNGQIVAILSYEARRGILTANATTPYYLGFADLSAGPLVLDLPARGVQGGASDAWQTTIPGTETAGKYPIRWHVEVPGLGLQADITTPLANQELSGSIGPSYWEGAIDISGKQSGHSLGGVGYLEMTGYAPASHKELSSQSKPQ